MKAPGYFWLGMVGTAITLGMAHDLLENWLADIAVMSGRHEGKLWSADPRLLAYLTRFVDEALVPPEAVDGIVDDGPVLS